MIKIPPDTVIKWKPASIFPKDSELEGGVEGFSYFRHYLGLVNYKWGSRIVKHDQLTLQIVAFHHPLSHPAFWSPNQDDVEVLFYAELPEFLKADYLNIFKLSQ